MQSLKYSLNFLKLTNINSSKTIIYKSYLPIYHMNYRLYNIIKKNVYTELYNLLLIESIYERNTDIRN